MADIAAKREARRRRILQNSESRLQSITQSSSNRFKEKTTIELDSDICRKSVSDDFISSTSFPTTNDEIKYKDREKNIIDDIFNFQECEFSKSDIQSQEADHFQFSFSDQPHSANKNEKSCNNLNLNPTLNSSSHASYKQHQHSPLSNLFFGSLSCIILAAFVNVLLVIHSDISLYKSIITPYIIMEITRLCIGTKIEESQGNKMLAATLILCNIKPEIVQILKMSLDLCTTILKNFALYLTSFVLFNWIASIFGIHSSLLRFF